VIKHWKYGYVPRSTAALKITQLMVEMKFLGLPVYSPQVFQIPAALVIIGLITELMLKKSDLNIRRNPESRTDKSKSIRHAGPSSPV
jgi:hypothetical protein